MTIETGLSFFLFGMVVTIGVFYLIIRAEEAESKRRNEEQDDNIR
jgi:preprotein translocase subunit YajC